jgi:hypothetical protein
MSESLPIDSSREQLVSQQDAELKRMRVLATGLLVLMTGVFAVRDRPGGVVALPGLSARLC